jgi:2-C-methyl-D-erythritol 4-phosphate cytidylyltransferase
VIAQTPQIFRGEGLLAAYAQAAERGYVAADTAEVVRNFGILEVAAVPGDASNIKVTDQRDMDKVRAELEPSRSEPQ